jgi:hypothetical protein
VSETIWNAWKMMTFGLLLVGATALVTTLVMSYRADHDDVKQTGAASPRKASVPSQLEVAACRAYAQQRTEDKAMAVSKDVAISGAGDAGVNTAEGAITGGGIGAGKGAAGSQYQAAYRSCMRQKGY